MAQRTIITREKALARTLDLINRRLTDTLYDDPAGNGQVVLSLRALRATLKAQRQPPA